MAVRDELANNIKSKLKTFADNRNVAIRLKHDLNKQQERYQFLSKVQVNAANTVDYAPATLTFDPETTGKGTTDITIWGVTLEIAVQTIHETTPFFVNVKQALEDLRKDLRINNSRFFVLSDSVTYQVKSKATDLSRIGLIETQAGYTHVLYQMTINMVSGIGIQFGDDEIFELQNLTHFSNPFIFAKMDFISKDTTTGILSDSTHPQGDSIGITIPQQATWNSSGLMHYNDTLLMHRALYDVAMDNQEFDDVYQLRITKPNTGVITKNVSVEVRDNALDGNMIALNVVFKEV